MSKKDQIDLDKLPKHVAIIMDGNGRWAKQKGAMRIFGHRNAVQAVRDATEAAAELGVEVLTLYAFSTENWGRPKEEVEALMQLLVSTIRSETKTLNKNNIRLESIGDTSALPKSCQIELAEAKEITAKNSRMTLVLALNYSGRWEITKAMQLAAERAVKGEISPEAINEAYVSSLMETVKYPDPELLIRTSGEMRISNFLLWQIAYTELYITSVLWPDFNKDCFYDALLAFQARERRFGKVLETETPPGKP